MIEVVKPIGPIRETKESRELQEAIVERASLFYSEHPKSRIKKDDQWLKMVKVKEVDDMETSYTLDSIIKIKKRFTTACILQDKYKDSWTLYVTPDSDSLDVSEHIVKQIYVSHEWRDVFCLNVLLTAELSSLKRKGYPVDQIMKQRNLRYEKYVQSVEKSIVVTPEFTQNLRNSLRNAIKACNSNIGNINDIFSQASITILNESQTSYCDIIPGISNILLLCDFLSLYDNLFKFFLFFRSFTVLCRN